MTTIRMATVALGLAALAAGLTGCASTTAESTTPATPQPAVASSAPAASLTAQPINPPPTTCPEFAMTAAHMGTDWHYLKINLGTTNDEGPTLADLQTGSAAMQELAKKCAPKAADAIDAFAATVGPVVAVYTTQPTGDQAKQVDDALAAMQDAGAKMFTALDQSPYAWE